jgi:hypothetical protein
LNKLPQTWLKGKTEQEQAAIRSLLSNSSALIHEILHILDQLDNEEARAETNLTEYDNPSWSHKQADRNGARRAYRKIKQLFQMETTH